ncbi:delta-60 repeat domain-containing protein [Mucilaginibacter pineti]|uniref:Delta-60 repeat domain-containing protein n=1 Tax=Mucilaginibacter pineti TaxID=1391627 RepID=A0A1G6WXK0_9SPHI|nr:DUF5008 domain-containing protein [Mucilaginibacter pineti]SDD70581.1 delta-60 repeat domain-containing protein [Mucilaginibacter pineti]
MISNYIKSTGLNLIKASLLLLLFVQVSCKKTAVLQADPYGGGKSSLGIKFVAEDPNPNSGSAGDAVTFKVTGLLSHKGNFQFLVNEIEATVTDVSDSTVTITIPENASSGGTTVIADGQSFFGPRFTVDGKVSIDASFKAVNGTNAAINDLFVTNDGSYLMVGAFTNFESQAPATPVNRIVLISRDGQFQTDFNAGAGAGGTLQTINRLDNGQYIVGGSLATFNNRKGINGITRLNIDGSLDSASIEVINLKPTIPSLGLDTVATFNGGVYGSVVKSFVRNGKITILGNFQNYVKYFYLRSTRDFKVADVTKMNQIARLTTDGTMDSTFNYNPVTRQGYAGGNGDINDAFMQTDGKIVAVGAFSTFNGVSANHIVRLNLDGSVDETFKAGAGADGAVTSVRYNTTTGKIILAGAFKTFDGKNKNGVVLLNADGSTDDTFQFSELVGGVPNFAGQLNNGKILVSGNFNKYNAIVRQGFMILNADGSLAAGYNNTGAFEGKINKVIETTSALGNPAVVLVGDFVKFDNTRVGNIVRVELKK